MLNKGQSPGQKVVSVSEDEQVEEGQEAGQVPGQKKMQTVVTVWSDPRRCFVRDLRRKEPL